MSVTSQSDKSMGLRLEGRSTPTKPTAESDCNLPSMQVLGYNTSICSTSRCLVATDTCGTVDDIQNLSRTPTVPVTYTHCSHSTHYHRQLMWNLNFIFEAKAESCFLEDVHAAHSWFCVHFTVF